MNGKVIPLISAFITIMFLVQPVGIALGLSTSETITVSGSRQFFQSSVLDLMGYQIYITGSIEFEQNIDFISEIEKTKLNNDENVSSLINIHPHNPNITLIITFSYGGDSYTYNYSIDGIEVPGNYTAKSIPIPVGEMILLFGLPPLPIHINVDFQAHSKIVADVLTEGFSSEYDSLLWRTIEEKSSSCVLLGSETGEASISLTNIGVIIEFIGKISVGVPIIGDYTLYTFPMTEEKFYSNQIDNVVTYYQLLVSSSYGSTTGEAWYYAGTDASFSVTPSEIYGSETTRYVFTNWIGSGTGSYSGSLATGTVTMNNAVKETAYWETQYLLTINAVKGGSINPVPDSYWKHEGETVLITAHPDEGYLFGYWILNGENVSSNQSYELKTNSPNIITVKFIEKPWYDRIPGGILGLGGGIVVVLITIASIIGLKRRNSKKSQQV